MVNEPEAITLIRESLAAMEDIAAGKYWVTPEGMDESVPVRLRMQTWGSYIPEDEECWVCAAGARHLARTGRLLGRDFAHVAVEETTPELFLNVARFGVHAITHAGSYQRSEVRELLDQLIPYLPESGFVRVSGNTAKEESSKVMAFFRKILSNYEAVHVKVPVPVETGAVQNQTVTVRCGGF